MCVPVYLYVDHHIVALASRSLLSSKLRSSIEVEGPCGSHSSGLERIPFPLQLELLSLLGLLLQLGEGVGVEGAGREVPLGLWSSLVGRCGGDITPWRGGQRVLHGDVV